MTDKEITLKEIRGYWPAPHDGIQTTILLAHYNWLIKQVGEMECGGCAGTGYLMQKHKPPCPHCGGSGREHN